MAVVIITAFILSKGRTEDGANPKAFKYILIIAGTICAIILPENFSTAFLLFGVVVLMMFIGHVPLIQLGKLIGTLVGLGIVALTFIIATKDVDISFLHRFDTWRARIEKFVSNEEIAASKFDTDKDGQVAHARIAVATSHVIGKGPGNSVQRDFLSQAFSDFIFAIVIEELGLLGGAFVVFLYICLLIRVGRIAKRCNRSFPAFLVIGIGLLLVTQAVFNMMVAVGLAPVTGQPLPLISRGGTSTIINCVYIGMLLSVSRYTASIEQEELLRQAEVAPEKSAAVLLAEAVLAENQAQSAEEPTSEVLNSDSEFE
jgi:cell division protein FtsW